MGGPTHGGQPPPSLAFPCTAVPMDPRVQNPVGQHASRHPASQHPALQHPASRHPNPGSIPAPSCRIWFKLKVSESSRRLVSSGPDDYHVPSFQTLVFEEKIPEPHELTWGV